MQFSAISRLIVVDGREVTRVQRYSRRILKYYLIELKG